MSSGSARIMVGIIMRAEHQHLSMPAKVSGGKVHFRPATIASRDELSKRSKGVTTGREA